VRRKSIGEVNYAENVQTATGEVLDVRCDADEADDVMWLVVDQERRVDVEDEQRWTAEVVPATVVDIPAASSQYPSSAVYRILVVICDKVLDGEKNRSVVKTCDEQRNNSHAQCEYQTDLRNNQQHATSIKRQFSLNSQHQWHNCYVIRDTAAFVRSPPSSKGAAGRRKT